MSVLSDKWIRKMSKEQGMITPFEEKQVRGNSISYGLSSFGPSLAKRLAFFSASFFSLLACFSISLFPLVDL